MSGLTVWFLLVFVPGLALPVFMGIVVTIVGFIVVGVASMIRLDSAGYSWSKESKDVAREATTKNMTKTIKICAPALLICSLLGAAIPDRKEIAAIVLIPYMSNNAEFQKIPENLAKKLNEYLTDQISPEKKDE